MVLWIPPTLTVRDFWPMLVGVTQDLTSTSSLEVEGTVQTRLNHHDSHPQMLFSSTLPP